MSSLISTSLVNFINADTGDKLARADMRFQAIHSQLVKCMKGNATEYRAGRELALSLKTKPGKAWAAGFAAIAAHIGTNEPARYAYTGKCTPEVTAAIEAAAEPLAMVFLTGFETVIPTVKPEASEEDKAKAEARKLELAQARKAKALETAAAEGYIDKESYQAEVQALKAQLAEVRALTVAELVDEVVNAINTNQLDDDEITLLRAALALVPANKGKAKASKPEAIPA